MSDTSPKPNNSSSSGSSSSSKSSKSSKIESADTGENGLKRSRSDSPANHACHVCDSQMQKYTCPGCGVKSCSVGCVKKHKSESGCDGKRQRTGFVDVSSFKDSHIRSDLRFLEEVVRESDIAKRNNRSGKSTKFFSPDDETGKGNVLRGGLGLLVKQARTRGVRLSLMPAGMSRRKLNNTYFDRKSQQIHWHVCWRLGDLCMSGRYCETSSVQDCYKQQQQKQAGDQWPKDLNGHNMRLEVRSGSRLVDPGGALGDALKDTDIIEFPEIRLVEREEGEEEEEQKKKRGE